MTFFRAGRGDGEAGAFDEGSTSNGGEMGRALRWTVVLALACSLAVGAAACGGGDDDEATGSSAKAQEELKGTVTVWDAEYESVPEYTAGVDEIDREFERLHPGVKVDRVAQPFESAEAAYRAAFAAGEGPDIMVIQPGAAGILSFQNGLEPLNQWITPELQEQVTQWESVTPGFTAEGEHYGIPIGFQGWIFYYNKKLFAKAGLPTEFEPRSWAELREAGEKLQAAGIQPFVGGNKEGLENLWWFTVGFQTENTPQQAAELGAGELPYTDEAVTRAFEPMLMMEEAGLYPDDRFSTALFTEGYPAFAEGKGAMTLGLWNAAGYWGEFNAGLGEANVGIFHAPGTEALGSSAGTTWGIPKFADDKEAAWALMEYTLSREGMEILQDPGGLMPNRSDLEIPEGAAVQERRILEEAQERGTEIAPYNLVPNEVIYGPMLTEVSEVLQGRTTLEAAQKAMQETFERTATR